MKIELMKKFAVANEKIRFELIKTDIFVQNKIFMILMQMLYIK
jgi:hypothetical protein